MDELELLKKRVDELEGLVKAMLLQSGQVVSLQSMPIGTLVLGPDAQVHMNNCPVGIVLHGDQDSLDETETHLEDLVMEAEDLENQINDLEGRLGELRDSIEALNDVHEQEGDRP